jgi:hypothetical protein
MFYLPPGSMMQLMDGRVLHKDQKTNLWHDNLGVPITEQQLHFMMSFPSFSDDPSGGGNAPVAAETPASDPVVSLSAPFDDIFAIFPNTQNANRTIITTAPVTLRLTFQPGTYSSSAMDVFKNDAQIGLGIRISGSPPSPVTLSETFANGDQLKFGALYSSPSTMNYDVTIEKIEPGSVQVVDTFNVSCPAFSLGSPFDDIVAGDASEVQSATKYFQSAIGALTIRLNFSNGSYNGINGSLLVYKDNVHEGGSVTLIDTISVSSRPTQDGTGLYVLSQTYPSNMGLKFGFLAGDGGNDFDVTVEKTAPGELVTLDTFNVRASYSS